MADDEARQEPSPSEPTLRNALEGKAEFKPSPAMLRLMKSQPSPTMLKLQEFSRIAGRGVAEEQQRQGLAAERALQAVANSPAVRTAQSAATTAEAVQLLVAHAVNADKRERSMLLWARIGGVAGVLGLVVAVVLRFT